MQDAPGGAEDVFPKHCLPACSQPGVALSGRGQGPEAGDIWKHKLKMYLTRKKKK